MRLPPEEVREHVHLWLLAPERELPEVVITTRHGRTLVEPGALARRLGGRAQVVLVETGEATYALRDVLGDELAVWGGAARVYYPGFALTDRASQHPRIYAFEGRESEAERGLLAALGIEDAHAEDRYAVGDDVEGDVVSLDSRTATLALSDGCARVRAGDLARGFVHSCHDVLRIGQHVRARVRELAPDGTPWLDLQPFQADELATIAEQAGPGDVVRVRVRRRSNNGYQVELLPGADAFVPLQHCPSEIEAERDDVLAARIVRLDVADRRIVVSLADAPESAEGARPLRLYPDGPVFLASDDAAAQRAASELDRSEGELTRRPRAARAGARRCRRRPRRARPAGRGAARRARPRPRARGRSAQHARGLDRSRLAPARRGAVRRGRVPGLARSRARASSTTPPSARAIRSAAWSSARSSWTRCASCRACSLHKVLDACVHVATGRAAEIPGLELHPLRAGAGGTEQRQRADGARAWRCALQVHSPSARRLHFWRLEGDGGRARPRRHARRRHLTAAELAGEGEQRAGALQRALLVGELALERARLGGARAACALGLGEPLLDLGDALLVLAQCDGERADGRLRRLLRRARRAPREPEPSRRPAGAPPSRRRGGRAARSCASTWSRAARKACQSSSSSARPALPAAFHSSI